MGKLNASVIVMIVALIAGTVPNFPFSQYAFAEPKNVYVYVEELPNWASYASNVIYDATNAWTRANPTIKFYQASAPKQADLYIQWIKDYGTTYAGEHITGTGVIQIGLGDSNCYEKWQPYSSGMINRIAEHEIGHFFGLEHSSDPNNIMYHESPTQYGMVELEEQLAPGYVWFVPVCTQNTVTSYWYQVSMEDETYGFDVYFVSSMDEYYKAKSGEDFRYYSDKACSGKNFISYSGTCNGVTNNSGLLVMMPQQLKHSLATVTVKLQEQAPYPSSFIPSIEASSPKQPSLPSQLSLVVGQPMVMDQRGVKVTFAEIGSNVLIQSDISNYQTLDQPFVYIILVKDNNGVTQALSWLSGSLPSRESMNASQSWAPEQTGYYTVEVFVWQSINNPIALAPRQVTSLFVTV